LSITNWSVPPVHPSDPVIDSIELSVAPGEIAGIYGAVGSGRSELVMSLYGSRASTGQMLLDGKPISIASPREAVAAGVALVSEDRKVMGLEPWMSTAANITLPVLRSVSRGAVPHEARESRFAHDQAGSVGLPARMVAQQIVTLSGGNQQKGMLARALASKPRLLLLDEPTRGVDVGAKSDLHATLRELAAEGIAVVWVSSEAEELVEVAHRTHVMRDGKMVASFEAGDTSVAALVTAASSRDELVESKD
jgi:ABC-type sugar transport system, ATPase component